MGQRVMGPPAEDWAIKIQANISLMRHPFMHVHTAPFLTEVHWKDTILD